MVLMKVNIQTSHVSVMGIKCVSQIKNSGSQRLLRE